MQEEELSPELIEKLNLASKGMRSIFIRYLPGDEENVSSEDFIEYFGNLAESFLLRNLRVVKEHGSLEQAQDILGSIIDEVSRGLLDG